MPGSDASGKVKQAIKHDLRTPLAVILGRCELLLDETLSGRLTEVQVRSLETIQRQAERMIAMLDELASMVEGL